MTQSTSAEAAEVVAEDSGAKKFVTWAARFPFESREVRPSDWKRAGADLSDAEVAEGEVTVWSKENGWRVSRDEIPLTDMQLGQFMGANGGFTVIEG